MSFRCGELALPLRQHQTSSASLQKFCISQRSTADLSSLIFQRSIADLSSLCSGRAMLRPSFLGLQLLSPHSHIPALAVFYLRSRQSTKPHSIIRLLRSSQKKLPETENNVQSERLLQVSACATPGRASTRMPTVHSSKFCFHIVAVCLWSRRPCHVHRERLPHMSVCVCTSWAKLDENADDVYFSSVFIHIVAYYRSVLFVVVLSR